MTVPVLPEPDQVIVYQHNDRGGWRQTLEFGNYPTSFSFGADNDSISAIDVGSNARAVLYQHPDFGGRQAHFEGGFYYDRIGRINDQTSSIEIFPRQGEPAATDYLGSYPEERENFWSEDAQGLAHDDANWFVVRSPGPRSAQIFKVPLSYDLGAGDADGLDRDGIPRELRILGYDHLGDPDQRSGFLFVPIEDAQRENARIGVWRAEDLSFLSSFELTDNTDTRTGEPDRHTPWVAIRPGQDNQDTLWVSHSDDVDHVRVYDIDWERLTDEFSPQLILDNPRDVVLRDRDGSTITLDSMQGGVFSSSGKLLYTSNGSTTTPGYVHVFSIDDETNTATLQARSENGYYPFNFATDPGFPTYEEAEGLDWLDVRDLNIPHIPDGQLHVVMVDNDFIADDVYLKHYSSGITDLDIA